MRTIAYQRRSDELDEQQRELHPETYVELMEFVYGDSGFTVSNVVNEALTQFLSIGDIARSQERVEGRLETEGVPVPPGGMRETQEKISLVAENEKSWNQVFDVRPVSEWQDEKGSLQGYTLDIDLDEEDEDDEKENTLIYLNTSFDISEEVNEAPGYRSYVVNAAVEWWLNSPFDGACDRLLSLHQLMAAAEGEKVLYDEATEWVQRRLDGIRKQSDGDHHEDWEALFSSDGSSVFDISEVSVWDDVEIDEERAKEAWKGEEISQNGKNPAGVLAAVIRHKVPVVWEREEVVEVAEDIFVGASKGSREAYVDTAMPEVNTGIEVSLDVDHPRDADGNKVEAVPEMRTYFENVDDINGYVPAVLKKAIFGSRYPLGLDDVDEEYVGRGCDEFAAGIVKALPEEVWEDDDFVSGVEWIVSETYPEKQTREALDAHSPIEL